ncbi:M48 family metalloprotease [Crocosphaera sp. Alani8]|uniref:M48 family metalloprotease n=1 Tax=Crocosphaera sp. Alani8 TaxID=3038952 RepID=UPI00313B545E
MNQLKTVALLGMLSGLLVTMGYWLGGTTGAVIGLAMAAVSNLVSWYQSDKIALAAYSAQPLSQGEAPRLHQMVKQLCRRDNLPMPRLYVVPSEAANAFATGRDPQHAAIALTQGIINLLPPDELEGVIAHELSHIKNRDTLTQAVAATIAGAISFALQYSLWFGGNSRGRQQGGGNPLGLLLAIVVTPLAATVIQMAISRTREFAADASAAALTGNPRALAQALERLEQGTRGVPLEGNPCFEPLLIVQGGFTQNLANLFATHPSTEARIKKLLQLELELKS